MIHAIHEQAGDIVADDCWPGPATLAVLLLQAGLSLVRALDGIDRYMVIAHPMLEG